MTGCEAETYLRALAFAGPNWTLRQCYDHIERFTIEAVVHTVTDTDAITQAQRADQARVFWQERFEQSADRVNALQDQLAAANADRARLREALEAIRFRSGRVCGKYETCTHVVCESSYYAWATADLALLAAMLPAATTGEGE